MSLTTKLLKIEFIKPFVPHLYSNIVNIMIIFFGFTDKPYIAFHVAIILSAINIFLYAFSSNSRNLIYSNKIHFFNIFKQRTYFLIPLCVLSFILALSLSKFSRILILIILLRKFLEWIIDPIIANEEINNRNIKKFYLVLFNEIFTLAIAIVAYLIFRNEFLSFLIITIGFIFNYLIFYNFIKNSITVFKTKIFKEISISYKNYLSTFIVSLGTLLIRLIIDKYFDDFEAGRIVSGMMFGGLLTSIFSGPIGSYMVKFNSKKIKNKIMNLFYFLFILSTISSYLILNNSGESVVVIIAAYSISGSFLMSNSSILKNMMLQKYGSSLSADFLINLTNIIMCFLLTTHYRNNIEFIYILISANNLLIFLIFSKLNK